MNCYAVLQVFFKLSHTVKYSIGVPTAGFHVPFHGLWWAGAASVTTRYPEPAWSRCRSAWTAAWEYVQTSFDLDPTPVWPGEDFLSGTRHPGDPAEQISLNGKRKKKKSFCSRLCLSMTFNTRLYLINLKSFFEPVGGFIEVSFVPSHRSKTQITCRPK